MKRIKSHRSLILTLLVSFFCVFISNFCLAQYSAYFTVPKIIFKKTYVTLTVYSQEFKVTDSVQTIRLSVKPYRNADNYYIDSIGFKLKGMENLKMVSSKEPVFNGISYSLEYIFKRTAEPFPNLNLEVYSGQRFLGATKLIAGNNSLRIGLADPKDSLTTYRYGTGCIYISPVKHLVEPTLPATTNLKYKFKHQVKPSGEFKLQERKN